MIQAVLFDLDETLFDRTTSLVAFLSDQYGRFSHQLGKTTFGAWRDRFLALDARGHVYKSIVYDTLLAEFGGNRDAADILLDDYRARCSEHARGFPDMPSTLKALLGRGLRLGLVTNGETEFQSRHIDALGLSSLFDAILISERETLRKPDPAIFLRAANRLGVAPPDCLFVGDNPVADILGAHAVGMRTAWFRSGAAWPGDLPPLPGTAIDSLAEIIDLVGAA